MTYGQTTDPDLYIREPNKLTKLFRHFLNAGGTKADAINMLQNRGFNLPQNLVETPAIPIVEEAVVSEPALPPAGAAVGPTTARHPLAESSEDTRIVADGEDGTGRLLSITQKIPGAPERVWSGEAADDQRRGALPFQYKMPPMKLQNPLGDPEFVADIEGSFSKIPGPAEPEVTKPEETKPEVTEVEALAVTDETIDVDLERERLTNDVLETLNQSTQDVVAKYKEVSGPEFFEGRDEMPYKADILQVDVEIKALNDRLEQIGEEKIKPYFGKDDTWRKILAAIAAGAGAYASAMSGTPNYALQILNKAIDDDLDKQKLEIGFRSKNLEDQRILLTTKRLELLKMTEMALNKSWRQAQDFRSKQKLETMLLEVNNKFQMENEKLLQERADKLFKLYTKELEGILPNMGKNPGEPGRTTLTGPGRDLIIKKAITFSILYIEAKDHVEELLKLVTDKKLEVMTPEIFSDVRSMFMQRITALKLLAAKKLYEFGAALTINEEKLLDEIIADASKWKTMTDITTTRLTNFMDIMETKRKAIRDTGDFQPVGQTSGGKKESGRTATAIESLEPGTSSK